MSIRRRILKELREFGRLAPGGILAADGMKVWAETKIEDRKKIELALNQLLDESLILGIRGPPISVRVNPDRLNDIDRELRTDWKWLIGIIVAILGTVAAFLALRHSN